MQKVKYEVDPFNRLIKVEGGLGRGTAKMRKVLDGRFRLDEKNGLTYHVKASVSNDEARPHQVKIAGNWRLNDGHELELVVDKEGRETFGDQVTLKGQLFDAGKDSLSFLITTRSGGSGGSTYILKLSGMWKADKFNRLSFYAIREKGRYDIITLSGAWEIGEGHKIIYRYDKAALIRKKSEAHALTFTGHWDIREKLRLSYALDADSGSGFDFKTGAAVLDEGHIKYEIGIGFKDRGSGILALRTVTLSGQWKIKKDAGIFFEVEYGEGRVETIVFGADAQLGQNGLVSFMLRDGVRNKGLNMTLEISRDLLKGDGGIFLRALASKRELAVYAGAAWRW